MNINESKPVNACYTSEFEESLSKLSSDKKIADEFIRGTEYIICQNPTHGIQIAPDSKVWCVPMVDLKDTPTLHIYYTFDEELAYFLSITESES